ncbi:MAG: glycosyltransferase family 39 protein [Deltaproteobacteria bacterium]|nr:glycosyltransferase family 39 protein [Deltaproteobacteria bacterium]
MTSARLSLFRDLFSPAELLMVVGVLFVILWAPVRYTNSDMLGTLLVSQTILEDRTVRLDAHVDDDFERTYSYRVRRKGEHWYHYFPMGSQVFAVPYVATLRLAKQDMADPRKDENAQLGLCALLVATIALVLVRTGRMLVSTPEAVGIGTIAVLGGPLASTAGTALWSSVFTALFVALALHEVVRFETGRGDVRPPWLGFVLFAAYLCRPTAALFVLAMLIYAASRGRRLLLSVGGWAFGFLLVFVVFSLWEFGQVLPDYYAASRVGGVPALEALWGNIASPSRGLLVYAPHVAIVTGIAVAARVHGRLVALIVGWAAAHWLVISTFQPWWGGSCFGPRFFTEVFPGFALLAFVALRAGWEWKLAGSRFIALTVICVLALFAVYANTAQGLYEPVTAKWNWSWPHSQSSEYLFDWRFPQFAYTEQSHAERERYYTVARLPALTVPLTIRPRDEEVYLTDWHRQEEQGRWSRARGSRITFKLGALDPAVQEYELLLDGFVLQEQRIKLRINGRLVSSAPHQRTTRLVAALSKQGGLASDDGASPRAASQ